MSIFGVMRFWYCYTHDDGFVCFHPNEIYNLENENNTNPPKWLNYCAAVNCVYNCEGIVELASNVDIDIKFPVKTSFEKEASEFQFEYYLHNIYDANNKTILENMPILLLDWFNETIKKIKENT